MNEADKKFAIEQFKLMLDPHLPTAQAMFLEAFTAGFDRAKAEAEAEALMQKRVAYKIATGDHDALCELAEKVNSFSRLASTRKRAAKEALYGPEPRSVLDPRNTTGMVVPSSSGSGVGAGSGSGISFRNENGDGGGAGGNSFPLNHLGATGDGGGR